MVCYSKAKRANTTLTRIPVPVPRSPSPAHDFRTAVVLRECIPKYDRSADSCRSVRAAVVADGKAMMRTKLRPMLSMRESTQAKAGRGVRCGYETVP